MCEDCRNWHEKATMRMHMYLSLSGPARYPAFALGSTCLQLELSNPSYASNCFHGMPKYLLFFSTNSLACTLLRAVSTPMRSRVRMCSHHSLEIVNLHRATFERWGACSCHEGGSIR